MSENFKVICDGDVNVNNLAIQLSMLPDVIKTANQEHKLGVKKLLQSALCVSCLTPVLLPSQCCQMSIDYCQFI